jgi:hypothetical protein
MRTLRRIGISLALTMTVLMIAAGASFLLSADRPEHPVGFQIVAVPNRPSKPLQVAVWYPTGARPGLHFVQFAPQIVAANGTVAGWLRPVSSQPRWCTPTTRPWTGATSLCRAG